MRPLADQRILIQSRSLLAGSPFKRDRAGPLTPTKNPSQLKGLSFKAIRSREHHFVERAKAGGLCPTVARQVLEAMISQAERVPDRALARYRQTSP